MRIRQLFFVATEAARAGGQAIDPAQAVPGSVDPQAAQAAAQAYLRLANIAGTATVSADGKTLTVTTQVTYATKFLSVAGIGSMAATGHGKATLLHGITALEGP